MNTINCKYQPNFQARLVCNLPNPDTRWENIAAIYKEKTKNIKNYRLSINNNNLENCIWFILHKKKVIKSTFNKFSQDGMKKLMVLSDDEVAEKLKKFTQIICATEDGLKKVMEEFSVVSDKAEIYEPEATEVYNYFYKYARKGKFDYAKILLDEDKIFRNNFELDV